MRVGHVINFMITEIHAARCNFMKFRLPNMRSIFIDQSDTHIFVSSVRLT